MKKIYAFLAMALLSMSAMAGTVVFTAADFKGGAASPGAHLEAVKSGVTVSTENGYKADDHIRVFGGGTYTLEFSSEIKMTKIAFEWAATGNKYEGPATETPNATEYTVTATKQMRIAKITVTVDGEVEGEEGDDGDKGDEVVISGLMYADAYYWTDEEGYGVWDIDLYKDYDYETYVMTYPEVYLQIDAESKTSLVGTYPLYYGGYWKSANDSIESDIYAEDFVGELTISSAKGEYTFEGSFEGTDGKIYSFTCHPEVFAFDLDEYEEIELDEEGLGVENVATEPKAMKSIENGQLIIRRGENCYNVMGQKY